MAKWNQCIIKKYESNAQITVGPQHMTVSNTLLCTAIYCVKQNTVSILAFNIHLFNFLLSICCDHIMLWLVWPLFLIWFQIKLPLFRAEQF